MARHSCNTGLKWNNESISLFKSIRILRFFAVGLVWSGPSANPKALMTIWARFPLCLFDLLQTSIALHLSLCITLHPWISCARDWIYIEDINKGESSPASSLLLKDEKTTPEASFCCEGKEVHSLLRLPNADRVTPFLFSFTQTRIPYNM